MASQARLGSFDDLIQELSPETELQVEAIARQLREVILAGFPEAVEVVRLGDKAASYGIGPKKMSESHVYIMPRPKYVNLGFWHGINIKDPIGLLEGTGKKMRHVKVHSLEQAKQPEIRELIDRSLAERRAALKKIE